MPLTDATAPVLAAGITATAGAGAQIYNALAQNNMNRKNRAWNEAMYERQKQDALTNWMMQNQYNSPQEQMRRLKEAGLNPNLVYGNGTVANNATTPQTPQSKSSDMVPYRVDPSFIGDSVNTYFNVMRQKQEVDNLEKQNKLIDANILLTMAKYKNEQDHKPDVYDSQSYLNWMRSYGQGFDNDVKRQTVNTDIKVKEESLRKLIGEIEYNQARKIYTESENTRKNTLIPYQIASLTIDQLYKKSMISKNDVEKQRLLSTIDMIREQTRGLSLENDLREDGASFKDGIIQRNVMKLIGDLGEGSISEEEFIKILQDENNKQKQPYFRKGSGASGSW